MTKNAAAEAPEKGTPATKSRTKPGQHGLFVSVSDADYALLEQSADGRPLNVWLSRLIARHAGEWPELKP